MKNNKNKCTKCFLTPDTCGAHNRPEVCNKIYESKWSMFWEDIKEFGPIVVFLAFIIMGLFAIHYLWATGQTIPWLPL